MKFDLPRKSVRLLIRRPQVDDAEFFARLNASPDVRRSIGPVIEPDVNKTREKLRELQNSENAPLIIELLSTGGRIGYTGFVGNEDIDRMEIQIALDTPFWGQGYGTEVLDLLAEIWFGELNPDVLTATVWPDNNRAIKLLNTKGFLKVGEYVDSIYQRRHIIYELRKRNANSLALVCPAKLPSANR